MRGRHIFLAVVVLASSVTIACTSAETSTAITSPSSNKCQINVSNAPSSFGAGGGQGTLTINAARDCAWSISVNANWVSLSGPASGQGDASVSYSVAANPVPSA